MKKTEWNKFHKSTKSRFIMLAWELQYQSIVNPQFMSFCRHWLSGRKCNYMQPCRFYSVICHLHLFQAITCFSFGMSWVIFVSHTESWDWSHHKNPFGFTMTNINEGLTWFRLKIIEWLLQSAPIIKWSSFISYSNEKQNYCKKLLSAKLQRLGLVLRLDCRAGWASYYKTPHHVTQQK